jgi:hypothetical protein
LGQIRLQNSGIVRRLPAVNRLTIHYAFLFTRAFHRVSRGRFKSTLL